MPQITIDAHQHFWHPETGGDYGWLSGPFESLNRRFDPLDLRPSLERNGVSGTVLVQTWNDLDETWEFIRLAAATDFVAGVVGWVNLTDANVVQMLAALKGSPEGRWLVGVRHLIQTEPDPNWLLRDDVKRGLRQVQRAGLVYDLVPNLPQLPSCVKTTEVFPELRFVLDHIAKPEIRSRRLLRVGGAYARVQSPARPCLVQAFRHGDRGELADVDAGGSQTLRDGGSRHIWRRSLHVRLRLAGLSGRGQLRAGDRRATRVRNGPHSVRTRPSLRRLGD